MGTVAPCFGKPISPSNTSLASTMADTEPQVSQEEVVEVAAATEELSVEEVSEVASKEEEAADATEVETSPETVAAPEVEVAATEEVAEQVAEEVASEEENAAEEVEAPAEEGSPQ